MSLMKDWFRINAERYPDKTAIVFEDTRLTFEEVYDRVNSVANGLLHMGIKKGDRIAVLSENCHQCLELWGVAAKIGAILVPINYRLHPKEMENIIVNSEPSAVFFQEKYSDVINSLKDKMRNLNNYISIERMEGWKSYEDMVLEFHSEEPEVKVGEDDVLFIVYTSGTTGVPKGAMITNKNVFINAIGEVMGWGVTHDEINLVPFPLCTTGGIVTCTTPWIYMGCTNIILKRFDSQNFMEIVQKERVTSLVAAPTMLIFLMEFPDFHKYDISSLKRVLYGGASMPVEPLKRAVKAFGNNIIMQGYGQTESTGNVTVLTKEHFKTEGTEKEMRRLFSCGKGHTEHEVDVFNEEGKRVKVGEVGEVVIRGDTVMAGYWKMPEATAETIRGGWLYTGDMATRDEDGYIYIVDRKKDMIISGGANIYPREIEEVIYKHPSVSLVAVVGVPDEVWGESVKAFIQLKEGKTATEQEIIDLCKDNLGSYKKPKYVEFVESLPTDTQGKVLKKEIRKRYLK